MDSEIIKSSGAMLAHPATRADGNLVQPPTDEVQMLELCAGYNALAYDPSVDYSPWFGVDRNVDEYTDRTLSTALDDPYYPQATTNITDWIYFEWNDSNHDGEYDLGECPRPCTDDPDNECPSQ